MNLEDLKKLAGVNEFRGYQPYGENISVSATEKRQIERDNNIKPGTDEWFRLWFTAPPATGFRGRKR